MFERSLHAARVNRVPLNMKKTPFYAALSPLALTMAISILPATGKVLNLTDTTVVQGADTYLENTVDVGGTEYHAGVINGSIFRRVEATDDSNSGAGVFRNLYKVSTPTGNVDVESGYNRNEMDSSLLGGDSHLMKVSDLASAADGAYAIFTIDANEANNKTERYISLDKFQIFVETDAPLGVDPGSLPGSEANLGDLGTEIYNMDNGSDSTVLLDYSTSNGSGTFDTYIFVPLALFAGYDPESYIYVYSQFGEFGEATVSTGTGDFGAGSGGEDVAYYKTANVVPITVTSLVPEPHSSALLALGGLMLTLRRRRA